MRKADIQNKILAVPDNKLGELNNMIDEMITAIKNNPDFKLRTESGVLSSDQDLLGRKYMAKYLSNLISEDIVPPFTIGIYGRWGSGKSVFLNFIKEYLDALQNKKCKVIYFNAWKYESTGNIMFSLLRKIEGELSVQRQKSLRKERMKRGIFKSFTNFINEKSKFNISSILKHSGIEYLATSIDDKYDSVKGIEEIFESRIKEVLEYEKKQYLVLLIDDLDRCNPEIVVNILESIKNYLNTQNCIFILAADKNVVTAGIKHKYSNSRFISGEDYLEKIVNLSLDLKFEAKQGIVNLIDHYHQTYGSIINKSKPDFLLTAFESINRQNVRCAKRILDKYVIILKDPVTLMHFDHKLILFVIILQEMLPELYYDIKRVTNNRLIDDIIKSGSPDPATNIEKLSEGEQLKYKYVLRTQVKDLLLNFKKTFLPGNRPDEEYLSPQVNKAIHYLETHIISG